MLNDAECIYLFPGQSTSQHHLSPLLALQLLPQARKSQNLLKFLQPSKPARISIETVGASGFNHREFFQGSRAIPYTEIISGQKDPGLCKFKWVRTLIPMQRNEYLGFIILE